MVEIKAFPRTPISSAAPVKELRAAMLASSFFGRPRRFIGGLHGNCGPAAVCWCVVSIVVDSIKRAIIGAKAHIAQEILKFSPPLANLNSAASVAVKSRRPLVVASSYHVCPTAVCRSSTHPVNRLAAIIFNRASATFGAAHIRAWPSNTSAARADAFVNRLFAVSPKASSHGYLSECSSNHFNSVICHAGSMTLTRQICKWGN